MPPPRPKTSSTSEQTSNRRPKHAPVGDTSSRQGRVAKVDIQRALNSCRAGAEAKAELTRIFGRAEAELKSERAAIDEAKARNVGERELESMTSRFKAQYDDFQRDLKVKDQELTAPIVEKVYRTVQQIGRSDGYDVIWEVSAFDKLKKESVGDIPTKGNPSLFVFTSKSYAEHGPAVVRRGDPLFVNAKDLTEEVVRQVDEGR
jgi:outer membrane protein